MILSLLVGGSLGVAYSYSLKRTLSQGSQRSFSSGLRSALRSFIFRLSSIALILYGLAHISSLNLSLVILSFITVISAFLLQVAVKAYLIDVRRRGAQPNREI
ncbi:MAG: hypothetical protein ACE5J1_01780 [Nitrospiria bacterium]